MKKNPLERKWEFETSDRDMAYKFLSVLGMFHILPVDTYIPTFLEYSQIEFYTTERHKKQIKFVFERYILPDPYKKFQKGRSGYYEIY